MSSKKSTSTVTSRPSSASGASAAASISANPSSLIPPVLSGWVTPGDIVGSTNDLIPGTGTYVLAGHSNICAGVVGISRITPAIVGSGESRSIVSVESRRTPTRLPAVGDVVTARVTRINPRLASLDIICLHSHVPDASATTVAADGKASAAASAAGAALAAPVGETYILDESLAGTIRQRDVRAFDIDSVELYKSFRPGDLVRAQVLSLGDARSYFLSTARNDLGVILATSAAGQPMMPISWELMQCPVTLTKEYRKVAKID
jgi:exosome complex component CSL4